MYAYFFKSREKLVEDAANRAREMEIFHSSYRYNFWTATLQTFITTNIVHDEPLLAAIRYHCALCKGFSYY